MKSRAVIILPLALIFVLCGMNGLWAQADSSNVGVMLQKISGGTWKDNPAGEHRRGE